MRYNYEGEKFLNRIYKDLYKSSEVEHVSDKKDTKEEAIRKYLERLKRVEEKAKISKYNGYELLKEMYYNKYIIKKENIKEEYFNHQKEMALERGYGHITITDEMKEEMKEEVITNQKKSLDRWLDYLINGNETYPEWYKYYVFQGMLRLGIYDKKREIYNKRTETTVNDYPELNREAIALIYDNLNTVIKGKEVSDEVLNKLIENGSFLKLYSYMITKLNEIKKEINGKEGIWKKYDKGSEPDELVENLQGRGTGWCTAGIEVARNQLDKGDFYVYYTKDNEGAYVQPRIAVRMEGNKIGEIRGIGEKQNLEPDMEEILAKKLEEFPDKEEYKKKVSDMEKLTKIYKEYKEREISEEEIRFLYEVDENIEGFGYSKDPRIEEILSTRNFKKDLSRALNVKEEEISNNKRDVLNEKNVEYFYGDLDLSSLTSAEGLKLPNKIGGDLDLSSLTKVEGLVLPKQINGILNLGGLTSAEGLKLPDKIGGGLDLSDLKNAKGLKLPDRIGGYLNLGSLTSAEGLKLPDKIGGNLDLFSLTSAEGLVLPNQIGGALYLVALESAKGLKLPDKIGGNLNLSGLTNAEGLILPKQIGGNLDLFSLTNAEGLKLPDKIDGNLDLSSITNAEGLKLPDEIDGSLNLSSLTSAEILKLPDKIGRSLYLGNLTNAEGLKLSGKIGGGLYLGSLTSAEGLKLPDKIDGNLDLSSLTNAEGLKLPDKIGDDLDLSSLTSAEGLKLPDEIGGYLDLSSLTNAEGLVLPKQIDGNLDLSSLTNIEDLKLPTEIGGLLYLNHSTYDGDSIFQARSK